MPVQITIRDVPDAVRDELKARAAARRMSMQEYLLAELERLTSRPAPEVWLARVHARKRASDVRLDREDLLAHLAADRR